MKPRTTRLRPPNGLLHSISLAVLLGHPPRSEVSSERDQLRRHADDNSEPTLPFLEQIWEALVLGRGTARHPLPASSPLGSPPRRGCPEHVRYWLPPRQRRSVPGSSPRLMHGVFQGLNKHDWQRGIPKPTSFRDRPKSNRQFSLEKYQMGSMTRSEFIGGTFPNYYTDLRAAVVGEWPTRRPKLSLSCPKFKPALSDCSSD